MKETYSLFTCAFCILSSILAQREMFAVGADVVLSKCIFALKLSAHIQTKTFSSIRITYILKIFVTTKHSKPWLLDEPNLWNVRQVIVYDGLFQCNVVFSCFPYSLQRIVLFGVVSRLKFRSWDTLSRREKQIYSLKHCHIDVCTVCLNKSKK